MIRRQCNAFFSAYTLCQSNSPSFLRDTQYDPVVNSYNKGYKLDECEAGALKVMIEHIILCCDDPEGSILLDILTHNCQ